MSRSSFTRSPLWRTLTVGTAALIVAWTSAPSLQVRGADVAAGVIYRDTNIVVKAFEVPHGIWPHAFGYRVETPDRTIVISGDTRPSDAIARECAGCDVLLHEVYSAEGFSKIPARAQSIHSSAHDLDVY